MTYHYTDLVYVAGKHDTRVSVGVNGCNTVTSNVDLYRVGEGLCLGTPDAGWFSFKAGWAGAVQQRL